MANEMDVAGFFKYIRSKNGWSQRELADLIGVNQGYIAQLETGKYQKLPMPIIKQIYKKVLKTKADREELVQAMTYEFYKYLNS